MSDNPRMALPKVDIDTLSPAERLELIERIWDSLSSDDVELTAAQQAELAHRIEDMERHPEDSVSMSEALRRLRRDS